MEKYISAFQADAAGKDARDASTVNGVKGSDVYLFFFFHLPLARTRQAHSIRKGDLQM